jgi:hypothetical protein
MMQADRAKLLVVDDAAVAGGLLASQRPFHD